jgi:hypothetical protein
MIALLALLFQAAPEPPELSLARRCDSGIPWLSDGVEIQDGTPKSPGGTLEPRLKLLARAQSEAREKNRLILWYCPRVPGSHMYRARVLDTYARVALFTDPALVELIKGKFIPLRMASDEAVSEATGIRFPTFIEPGLVLFTPDGRKVHVIDRLRTFNPDWVRSALVAVLRKADEYNAPVGSTVEELLRGGDDEIALPRATPDQKAWIFRHSGRFREVLDLPCAPLERGIAYLGLKEFGRAEELLGKQDTPEALYFLAATRWWMGKEPEDVLRALVAKHPQSPWAWRAASYLVRDPDGLRQSPLAHNFEDFFLPPPQGLPRGTAEPAKDPQAVAARALEFLLRAQRSDGSWSDARYSYGWAGYMVRKRVSEGLLNPDYVTWPDRALQPNVFAAITSLAALALLEWRELAPESVDRALLRAEPYLADEAHLANGQCEICFADAYRLLFFAARKNRPEMNRIVRRLAEEQDREGFFGHEYPSAFATAAVVRTLIVARGAGAEVPEALLDRAAQALLGSRGDGGRQPYRHETGKGPSSEKNSMGRAASCELALYECGRGSLKNVSTGVAAYFRHLERLESVRTCDYHADEELAGFFYFNDVFHTLEAARSLPEPEQGEFLAKFRAQILSVPEWDGSFLDSHDLGKSYGTAMALLILSRLR